MERRSVLRAAVAVPGAVLLSGAVGALDPVVARPRVTRSLAGGLRVPWGIAFLPNGHGLVSERDTGRVLEVSPSGGYRVAGHVPDVVSTVGQGGENGLLGIALHPDFTTNRWVYAYLSTSSDNRVVRMQYVGGRLGVPEVVLSGIPRSLHHNGGGLAFGASHLFVSTGDAEHPHRAQNRHSLSGKILRITDTGGVPAGNPFGNRVWSLGHRNVEGLAFDGQGRLWATEFGNHRRDELNHIVRGGNYGWPRVEGGDGRGGFRDPLATWRPRACSPSGIAIARGHAWVGALHGQSLWSVKLNAPHKGRKVRFFDHRLGRIRGVHRAPDGSLWITTSDRDGRAARHKGDDHVYRVVLG
jgi:glucose/arabinose dehydrogenase